MLASLSLFLFGCAAHDLVVAQPSGRQAARLSWLSDGVTTRNEVLDRWGSPAARFEGDRVFVYRLDSDFKVVDPLRTRRVDAEAKNPPWPGVRHDLVLVYDDHGVLEEHRLLRVR